jgi:hypothetical protein
LNVWAAAKAESGFQVCARRIDTREKEGVGRPSGGQCFACQTLIAFTV